MLNLLELCRGVSAALGKNGGEGGGLHVSTCFNDQSISILSYMLRPVVNKDYKKQCFFMKPCFSS